MDELLDKKKSVTYSITLKNIMKIEKLYKKKNYKNASQLVNELISRAK